MIKRLLKFLFPLSLLTLLFPETFLWNNGVSPYNGTPWRQLPFCEDGTGVWSYTDGSYTFFSFGGPMGLLGEKP